MSGHEKPDLSGDYAGAGFGQRLEPGRSPALVVVDMVQAYFDPTAELYLGTDDCLASAARVLAAARTAGIPVVHTRVSFADGGLDGGAFFRKVGALKQFVGQTPLGAIRPEVAPLPGEVVLVKQYASAFFGTSLSSTLTAAGIDTVIIVGVSTSGCIRATAVDAIQYGFVPLVVRDAVGDRDPRPHEANLFDLQAKYAEVLAEDDVLAYLRGVGG
ncbi:MAG TPA: isochorismatase family protein [Mycobacteriales bacterium]|jgi:maleamate amidohydrolase|nr:isochorismatase family protein [Mycobacteriales bacterium]